ncbi:MAG: RNA polymerase sigma factor [Pseudomonadota bacterium]
MIAQPVEIDTRFLHADAAAAQPIVVHHSPAPASEALFRQLVLDHRQRLYRFIVKHIGWGTDAEDLTQQAFVEAAQSYATFKGASELSTWLYGIAMNLVRNHLSRAPSRRYVFEDEEALADTSSDSPDPCEQLAQTQSVRALQSALDELPKDMRDVLLLVAMDELSYEDAATMLSIPVGTVRSRVSRARAALRKRLAAQKIELGF